MAESLEDRTLLFTTLREKFPNLKNIIIKNAMSKYNFDSGKIEGYLRQKSQIDDHSISPIDGSKSRASSSSMYSFRSATSEDNVHSSQHSPYAYSEELNKISNQKLELKKIEDAFKKLEEDKQFLLCKKRTLLNIESARFSQPSFPNAIDVEELEVQINRRLGIGQKSFSYANDLRQPSDMMTRFRGFGQPTQHHHMPPYQHNHVMTNSDTATPDTNVHFQIGQYGEFNYLASQNNPLQPINPTRNVLYPSNLNPNVYHSPTSIQAHLEPFLMAKRNSSHFPPGIEMPTDRAYTPVIPPNRPNSYQNQPNSSNNNNHRTARSHRRNGSYDGFLSQMPPLPPPRASSQWAENTVTYKTCQMCRNTNPVSSNHQISHELYCQYCSFQLQ